MNNSVARSLLTSGRSSATVFSSISHSTSTFVLGFMAMPACMPWSWMNFISSLGDVFSLEVPEGESAAVEEMAAS
jgi:hypothetical protein